jgi:hypothetical protein
MLNKFWLPHFFGNIVEAPLPQVLQTLLKDEVISKARMSPAVVFFYIKFGFYCLLKQSGIR